MQRDTQREAATGPGEQAGSWGAALAAAALFLLLGLGLILQEIPHSWPVPGWLAQFGRALLLAGIVLPSIGVGIGWVKGFPRWSYPYVGQTVLMSWYMMNAATPGLRVFNYTFGRRDLWGWRAWIPLLVVAVAALLITRSRRPLARLFSQVWADWTLATFALYGVMPLLVAASFDEMDRLYSLPFMVGLTGVMAGTALIYVRCARPRLRALALAAGVVVSVAAAVAGPAVYWFGRGFVNVGGSVVAGVVVIAVFLAPALVGLLHRALGPRQPAPGDL